VSLSMRLMGNIVGDHKLVGVFFGILPFLLPVPFMLMGVLVCVVQAVVFSLLTTVYISQAVAHEEH
jgi:F-type H+-transporting ATPase subunit a